MPDPILGATTPSPEFYQRIGMVATEWSWVETLMNEMLAHFCHADPGSMYVISQSASNATVTGWLRLLVEIQVKEPNSAEVILNLLKKADETRKERNTVVHGLWEDSPGPGFARVKTFSWSREEVHQDVLMSVHDLDGLIEDIQLLQLMFANLGIKMGFVKREGP